MIVGITIDEIHQGIFYKNGIGGSAETTTS